MLPVNPHLVKRSDADTKYNEMYWAYLDRVYKLKVSNGYRNKKVKMRSIETNKYLFHRVQISYNDIFKCLLLSSSIRFKDGRKYKLISFNDLYYYTNSMHFNKIVQAYCNEYI